MTKVEAGQILNLRPEAVRKCVVEKKIKTDLTGKIIDESVYEYKKELDERRKIQKPTWVHRNEF